MGNVVQRAGKGKDYVRLLSFPALRAKGTRGKRLLRLTYPFPRLALKGMLIVFYRSLSLTGGMLLSFPFSFLFLREAARSEEKDKRCNNRVSQESGKENDY